jgi:hypothetical protein
MSKGAIRALLAVSLCAAASGCNSRTVQDTGRDVGADVARVSAATSRPITSIDDRETLTYLASDQLEGRGIGSLGLERAGGYIAGQFQQLGLRPLPGRSDFYQPFEMTTAAKIGPETSLRVGDRTFAPDEDFVPVSISADGTFSGPVVFAGYGIKDDARHYDDYAALDVKGKVVLAMRYEPHDEKGSSRFSPEGWSDGAAIAAKAKLARDHGAVALLLVTPAEFHDEDRLLPLNQRAAGETPALPVMQIKRTVADELLRRGGSGDLKSLQRKIDRGQDPKPASFALAGVDVSGQVDIERNRVTVKNVVGYIPGKTADEYVIIGAHYDHLGRGGVGSLSPHSHDIHHGADDNASGTTALLMLADRFASGPTPDRSIIFIAFNGEEEGVLGSTYFVEHPPVPIAQMVAMLNLDMVGRVRTPSQMATTSPTTAPAEEPATKAANLPAIAAAAAPTTQDDSPIIDVGGSGTAPAFEQIVKDADARSPLQVRDIGKGGLGPSDHMSFALKKVPVLFLFSGLHADYHRPTDTADKINYRGIEQVVDLSADIVRQICDMPRQTYVDAADASSMRIGMGTGSSGNRVTLGVVPDYSSFDQGGGVRISGTSAGSPAAKAGLVGGDVIVMIGGKKIDTLQDLSDFLATAKAGQAVKVKLLRGSAKTEIELDATLAQRKD